MKNTLRSTVVLFTSILIASTMSAQETPKTPSAKELAEKGTQGDHIQGKRMQKKQLMAPPIKLISPDSFAPKQRKLSGAAKKNPKN